MEGNRNKQTILAIGILLIVILVIGLLVVVLNPPKLTLHATVAIQTVEIDGKQVPFTDGMTIVYNKPVTIKVTKDGYYDFNGSLDPAKDKLQEFTISPLKIPSAVDAIPVPEFAKPTPDEDRLLQAAKNNATQLLDFGQALNVSITDAKDFSTFGYWIYIIQSKLPPYNDPAIVILKDITGYGYVVDAGPGTYLGEEADLFDSYPPQVIQYLKEKGYVN